MLFGWWKRRRRRQVLSEAFPDAWNEIIAVNVLHDRELPVTLQTRMRQLVQIFVAEKNWEGCGGLVLTDEIKVTVAALACLMVVGMEDVYFDHVLSILVYPDAYIAKGVELTRSGIVLEHGQARQGEAWWRGPVILSWSDTLAGGRRQTPGHNLVLHEFAHQLDMMNGRLIDGVPPLETTAQVQRWIDVLGPEYDRLVKNCRHGQRGCIDCYGATNPAEFFAVVTEAFFESPQQLRRHHGEVYEVLRDYYRLDPISWYDAP